MPQRNVANANEETLTSSPDFVIVCVTSTLTGCAQPAGKHSCCLRQSGTISHDVGRVSDE